MISRLNHTFSYFFLKILSLVLNDETIYLIIEFIFFLIKYGNGPYNVYYA